VVQFGVFELNRRAGELRKHGNRIRLQPKSMQILCALLERPGEIVTRVELKARLWPDDTFVDFESGLNTAVNRLRLALGDSAEHPRYIETEARAGYRFIGAAPPKPDLALSLPPQIIPSEAPAKRRVLLHWRFAAVLGFLVIAVTAAIGLRPPDPAVKFRQITFRRGQVSGARFEESPRSILYTAQWENEPRRIYEAHVGDPVSRILGFEGLSLVALSRLGELAVLRSDGTMNIGGGTLSRVTINDGPIQQIAENIFGADWSSDGTRLALVRVVAGAQQLEFPEGRVLYHTSGWLSNLRVAPGDDAVAFIEHPVRHDDAGVIRIVDARGNAVTVAEGWTNASGLAWKTGDEIWFTAARDNAPRSVWAVRRDGRLRTVGQAPGIFTLRDIRPDGRVLLSVESRRLEMAGAIVGEGRERDFSLTDWSRVQQLSPDGSLLLFDESGEGAGGHLVSYVRKTRSGEIVRLRAGMAQGFDVTRSSAFVLSDDQTKLWRVPIGGGPGEELPSSGLIYQWARPFPDGTRLLALANLPQQPLGLFIQSLETGTANPLTGPMMVRNASVSEDGSTVAILNPEGKLLLYATTGGQPRTIASKEPLAPIRWSKDGQWLYVIHLRSSVQSSAQVSRLRIATGEIRPWKMLRSADTIGVNSITGVTIADDEKSYVYSYRRVLSDLYLAEGWK
jgi:DNA-binding winged helix-turn-helix (wHTH) protein/Tol biopolymer transport system component